MSPARSHLGDDGTTGMLGEGRLPKYAPRIETLGALDEASAALGLARALTGSPATRTLLMAIQRDLYAIMAEAAATPGNAGKIKKLEPERLEWLESQVHELEANVPIPQDFILPGDSLPGAALSLARATIRRAERHTARLVDRKEMEGTIVLPYLNRLSLACFLLELAENRSAGQDTSLAKK